MPQGPAPRHTLVEAVVMLAVLPNAPEIVKPVALNGIRNSPTVSVSNGGAGRSRAGEMLRDGAGPILSRRQHKARRSARPALNGHRRP